MSDRKPCLCQCPEFVRQQAAERRRQIQALREWDENRKAEDDGQ